jgi:hypothetical protein
MVLILEFIFTLVSLVFETASQVEWTSFATNSVFSIVLFVVFVSKPDVRKPLIETSNRFEPLSFLNDENQNESQYVEQKQNDEPASKKVMIIAAFNLLIISSFSWLCIVVTELTMLLSNFVTFKSSSFFCSKSVLS